MLLKREDQQSVFSFKLRGAYNKMAHLTTARARARRDRGVAPATTRRAWRSRRSGWAARATIVMPVTTPHIKIAAVEARGAKVVLHGDSYAEAYAQALRLQSETRRHVRPSVRRSRT